MKYKFIIMGLLLLVVAGCTETTTTSTVDGYYSCFSGDTEMISAEFASYAPTSSESDTYEPGEEIDIEILLNNKLPVDIDAGAVKFRLTQNAAIESVFTGAEVVTNNDLYAIDTETCGTEEDEVEIGPLVYQKDIDTKVKETITEIDNTVPLKSYTIAKFNNNTCKNNITSTLLIKFSELIPLKKLFIIYPLVMIIQVHHMLYYYLLKIALIILQKLSYHLVLQHHAIVYIVHRL